MTRRDEWVSHYDDTGQIEWAQGAGLRVERGHAQLIGERQVLINEPTAGHRRSSTCSSHCHRFSADRTDDVCRCRTVVVTRRYRSSGSPGIVAHRRWRRRCRRGRDLDGRSRCESANARTRRQPTVRTRTVRRTAPRPGSRKSRSHHRSGDRGRGLLPSNVPKTPGSVVSMADKSQSRQTVQTANPRSRLTRSSSRPDANPDSTTSDSRVSDSLTRTSLSDVCPNGSTPSGMPAEMRL